MKKKTKNINIVVIRKCYPALKLAWEKANTNLPKKIVVYNVVGK